MKPSSPRYATQLGEMDIQPPPLAYSSEADPSSSALFDWGDLLDFTVDDHFPISFDPDHTPPPTPTLPPLHQQQQGNEIEPAALVTTTTTTAPQVSDRVRKRDPRLTCTNFIAGRVPCACPEIDEKLEEAEGLPGKKRARGPRSVAITVRCQVPGCGEDITALKGYHKRHRVCLGCANASSVMLGEVPKRYCQQCGKFHLLSDFDEGKRSCRRKLERHNSRRRRKTIDASKGSLDKDAQGDLQNEDIGCDVEAEIDGLFLGNQLDEREALVESEEAPNLLNVNSDSGVSNVASGETQVDGGKHDSKFSLSPSYCDNKSAYSSMCPTGRISFKLYDWNPAEFPRRLRHQIFEWLANMPVELEGYIRPGCTILTAFIAMPTVMWMKLSEDPVSYLNHFLVVPGTMLCKRGPMLIYLNDMVFNLVKDGTSVTNVNVKRSCPRLHYVHPTCFEAGKPMEFVACGSNLLQPKFRFLVSYAGKYLQCDYSVALPHSHAEGGSGLDHQLFRISVPRIESDLFGPAFIEVENVGGLSNFIPVLIGDREMCSELKMIQQRCHESNFLNGSECEVSALRQKLLSEFVLDIAWLLRKPSLENLEQFWMRSQIQRCISLSRSLLHYKSTAILNKVLENLRIMVNKFGVDGIVNDIGDADLKLLKNSIGYASNILSQNLQNSGGLALCHKYSVQERECFPGSCNARTFVREGLEDVSKGKLGAMGSSSYIARSEEVPLLSQEFIMNMDLRKERPSMSCCRSFSNRTLRPRLAVFMIAVAAVCCGVCAVLFHPRKVNELAVSIRRCLTGRFRR